MENNEFPRWMYGPKGEAQIFQSEEDVPKGWSKFQLSQEGGSNEEVASSDEGTAQSGESVIEEATSPVEPSLKNLGKNKRKKKTAK